MTAHRSRPAHALSIDVEDYFQVEAFAGTIPRADWDRWPRRVDANTHYLLDRLAAHGARATFFTLGWVAERHPALIRRIVAEGHELASHGHWHERVSTLTPETFRADLERARCVLEDTGGVRVIGYRAPTFSIGAANRWAWSVLAETGHRYSSSVFPIRHDLYGDPDASRTPFRPAAETSDIWEIPLTTARLGQRNLPCAGGGYFRLFPYAAYRFAVRKLRGDGASPAIFYTHPWELDPQQPVVEGISRRARFRHRVNLHRMKPRFERLLADFRWDRMDRVFADILADAPSSEPALPPAPEQAGHPGRPARVLADISSARSA